MTRALFEQIARMVWDSNSPPEHQEREKRVFDLVGGCKAPKAEQLFENQIVVAIPKQASPNLRHTPCTHESPQSRETVPDALIYILMIRVYGPQRSREDGACL